MSCTWWSRIVGCRSVWRDIVVQGNLWIMIKKNLTPNFFHNERSMVFIIDGCSFHYAHTWSNSGISICWRHLVTSKESSNPIFFRKKTLFTSYVRNVKWATILYKSHVSRKVQQYLERHLTFWFIKVCIVWTFVSYRPLNFANACSTYFTCTLVYWMNYRRRQLASVSNFGHRVHSNIRCRVHCCRTLRFRYK